METAVLLPLITVYLLAGAVKGLAGFGLPTVAVALMALVVPPAMAASLMLVPSLLTNLWQYAAGAERWAMFRRLLGLNTGIVIGTWWGFLPGLGSGREETRLLIGLALLLYGLSGLLPWRLPQPGRHERWLGPVAGYLGGSLSAASGIFVVPVIIYLQSLGLRKEAMVTALGLCFLVATLSLGSELARVGELAPPVLLLSLLALLPAWLGMEVGRRCRMRLDEAAFRRWFMVCVALMGGYLVFQSLA